MIYTILTLVQINLFGLCTQPTYIELGKDLLKDGLDNILKSAFEGATNADIKEIDKQIKILGLNVFKIEITDIKIENFVYKKDDIVLVIPGKENNLEANINRLNIELVGNYTDKIGFINSKKKKFNIVLEAEANINIEVKSDNNKAVADITRLKLKHSFARADVGNIVLKILLKNGLLGKLIDIIADNAVKKPASAQINKILGNLTDIPIEINDNLKVSLNFTLYPSIKYTNDNIGISAGLEFAEAKALHFLTDNSHSFEYHNIGPNMLKTSISQETVNSLLTALYNTGNLQYDISDDVINIPDSVPFKINTHYFENVFTCMKQFPNQELIISIKSNKAPLASIDSDVINGSNLLITAGVNISIKLKNNKKLILISYNTDLIINVKPIPGEDINKIYFKINSITLKNTKIISPCDLTTGSSIENSFNSMSNLIIYIVDSNFLKNGIAIPSIPNVKLSNVDLQLNANYITVIAVVVLDNK